MALRSICALTIMLFAFSVWFPTSSSAAVEACPNRYNEKVNKNASDLAELFVLNGVKLLGENLDRGKLDFSVKSLAVVDRAMLALHSTLPETDSGRDVSQLERRQFNQLILGAGSYLGEVIRRNSQCRYRWIKFNALTDETRELLGGKASLGTVMVLSDIPGNNTFPLNKNIKLLVNGSEDTTEFFAHVAISEVE